MKIIALILSVYILGLNLTPCSDGDASLLSADEVAYEQVMLVDYEHDSQHMDLCTPFCQCQCCQAPICSLDESAFTLIFPDLPVRQFAHYNSISDAHPNPLLEPPRV